MDRRGFLRGAGLVAAGVVAGRSGRLPRSDVAERAYANEYWGDQRLDQAGVIWKVRTTEKLVALTFDDGPKPRNTAAVLDVLADRKARATFMVVGRNALDHPDLIRREIAGRHEVQNHSWSHADLAFTSKAETERQVGRGADVVESLTGKRPRFFRPPRGDVSGATLAAATRAESDILMWSLQMHEATYDAEGNAKYLLDNVHPGAIVLAHDTGSRDRIVGLRALPYFIDGLRDRGYELVTVSELVEAGSASR